MADHGTAIEWTHGDGYRGETWNPVTGCSKVSPGCAHCYAEALSLRYGWSKQPWLPENAEANVVLHPERLEVPLSWRKPRMVFVNSMSDLFHELVPDEFLRTVYAVMGSSDHVYQVLTKRPERAREFWSRHHWRAGLTVWPGPRRNQLLYRFPVPNDVDVSVPGLDGSGGVVIDPPSNVWLGVSIENSRFTWRADVLREVPAAVRFISAEPLLESLFDGRVPPYSARPGHNFRRALNLDGIDWLIAGGESGPGHRPLNLDHARELRDACLAAQVPFFYKQQGGARPKSGGKLLDGREWCEMPRVAA